MGKAAPSRSDRVNYKHFQTGTMGVTVLIIRIIY